MVSSTCCITSEESNSLSCFPEDSANSPWVRVELKRQLQNKQIDRSEIADLRTRLRYRDEPTFDVSVKCALLVVGTPLFCLFSGLWHLARIPIHLFSVPYQQFQAYRMERITFIEMLYKVPVTILKSWTHSIWSIVRIPFFQIALQMVALVGTICPYEARSLYSYLEQRCSYGLSKKQSAQYKIEHSPTDITYRLFIESLLDPEHKITWFGAYCFQPLGNLNDKDIIEITRRTPLSVW